MADETIQTFTLLAEVQACHPKLAIQTLYGRTSNGLKGLHHVSAGEPGLRSCASAIDTRTLCEDDLARAQDACRRLTERR